jgi:hypothetical protein
MEQTETQLESVDAQVLDDLAARVVERLLTRGSVDGATQLAGNEAAQTALATAAPPTAARLFPPIQVRGLTIMGAEQTQATQFFKFNNQGSGAAGDNSVPLVANKTLVLRVYVSYYNLFVPGATLQVTGSVTADRISLFPPGVTPLPAPTPINAPILAMDSSAIQRGQVNATLNFLVPASSCQGLVRFQITVWDNANSAFTSAVVTQYVWFGSVPTPRVHGVLIHYTGPNASHTGNLDIAAPTGLDLVATLAPVIRVYPISGFSYTGCTVIDFNGDLTSGGGGGCGTGWNQLFNTLQNMRSTSGTSDVYVGLLPSGVPTGGVTGCGGGGVAISYINSSMVFAQEIGHAFGRAHAPCGNPGSPDPNYPTYNSYPSGSIGEFGYDVGTNTVWDPSSTYDFMSYCGPVWVSPYTYVGLMNGIAASAAAGSAERPHTQDHVTDRLHLNVRIHRGGRVELLPSFHLEGIGSDVDVERGPNSGVYLDLVTADGEVRLTHRSHFRNPHNSIHAAYFDLNEVLPWFDDVRSIVVRRGTDILGEVPVGEAPKLTLRKPKVEHGVLTIEWTAQTASAGPAAVALVRYSNDDGQTWRTVAADLTTGKHRISLDTVPGGDRCRVQVVASAGIRTVTATSEPFEVEQKESRAYLVSPREPLTVKHGEVVTLQGGGFSPDAGMTSFGDVRWMSSLDGNLGAGYELVTTSLSVGFHVITLSVPDGTGGLATATTQITVTE